MQNLKFEHQHFLTLCFSDEILYPIQKWNCIENLVDHTKRKKKLYICLRLLLLLLYRHHWYMQLHIEGDDEASQRAYIDPALWL